MKEGIDYHIKAIGKYLELSSMSLAGFAAGVVDLTRRSYEINYAGTTNIGSLLIAKTIPKKPKVKPKPKAKPVKRVVAKGTAPKEE